MRLEATRRDVLDRIPKPKTEVRILPGAHTPGSAKKAGLREAVAWIVGCGRWFGCGGRRLSGWRRASMLSLPLMVFGWLAQVTATLA
jgi:hypothetical protein